MDGRLQIGLDDLCESILHQRAVLANKVRFIRQIELDIKSSPDAKGIIC